MPCLGNFLLHKKERNNRYISLEYLEGNIRETAVLSWAKKNPENGKERPLLFLRRPSILVPPPAQNAAKNGGLLSLSPKGQSGHTHKQWKSTKKRGRGRFIGILSRENKGEAGEKWAGGEEVLFGCSFLSKFVQIQVFSSFPVVLIVLCKNTKTTALLPLTPSCSSSSSTPDTVWAGRGGRRRPPGWRCRAGWAPTPRRRRRRMRRGRRRRRRGDRPPNRWRGSRGCQRCQGRQQLEFCKTKNKNISFFQMPAPVTIEPDIGKEESPIIFYFTSFFSFFSILFGGPTIHFGGNWNKANFFSTKANTQSQTTIVHNKSNESM